ncbi:DUF402 domain-containing protein [Clostridium sp.]|uniref:DUF402 domain-containing protein n=1 Tax=Clostridium sp. TaxID=1506 RepID=UPI0032175A31
MKRRYADKSDWRRVLDREFKLKYIDNEELKGYISIIYMKEVREPLVIQTLGQDYCIADKNYSWLQYFPNDKNFVVTVMINEKGEVIQWYFDISEEYQLTDNGIPFYDDLFLDLVVLTTGEVIVLDENELDEALEEREISKEQHEVASSQCRSLEAWIKANNDKLNYLTKKYYDYMKCN